MKTNAEDSGMFEAQRRHRALAVLCLLADDIGGAANEAVLLVALDRWALGGSRPVLRSCFEQLERLGLAELTEAQGVLVVRLTALGAEVADGRVRAEGVEAQSSLRLYRAKRVGD